MNGEEVVQWIETNQVVQLKGILQENKSVMGADFMIPYVVSSNSQ
jgi:hypothetical protein